MIPATTMVREAVTGFHWSEASTEEVQCSPRTSIGCDTKLLTPAGVDGDVLGQNKGAAWHFAGHKCCPCSSTVR